MYLDNVPKKHVSGLLFRVLGATALLGLLLLSCEGGKGESAPSATLTAKQAAFGVHYLTVRQWPIPNGGFGKVVVIDQSHRTVEDMKALGDVLQRETRNDRNAFVFIYDDQKAAEMQPNALNLSGSDGAFYDQHFIGTYQRNINTGRNALTIQIGGVNGPTTEIKY